VEGQEPRRGDDVDRWLKRWRDRYREDGGEWEPIAYGAIDDMLDDYRLHAGTGTPLDEEVRER